MSSVFANRFGDADSVLSFSLANFSSNWRVPLTGLPMATGAGDGATEGAGWAAGRAPGAGAEPESIRP